LKVQKDTTWRTNIMEEVVDAVRRRAVPSVEVPMYDHLKVFDKQMTTPAPDMAELVAATKARSPYRDHSKQ
jgi:formate hydrogenlyase subunit 4